MKHGTLPLETERLILRRISLLDAEEMFDNWASNDEVTKFLTWPTHQNIDITKMVISSWVDSYKENTFYQWGIELKDTHELIGTISSVDVNLDKNEVEVGYVIGQDYWNKGYTTEALKRVISYFFEEEKFSKILVGHDKDNYASKCVIKKCGFEYVGTHEAPNNYNPHGISLYYELKK